MHTDILIFMTAASNNYLVQLLNSKKLATSQLNPSLLAFISVLWGNLRPAEIDNRPEKFMLKFKGVGSVRCVRCSLGIGNIAVYYSYYCLMRNTYGLY